MEKNFSKQLEHLINAGTKRNPLPIKQGNSIRVGKVIIRYSKNKGYILFDCESSSQIHLAESKPGALAIARLYNNGNDIVNAKMYDKDYAKHENDCVFYQHTIENTDDIFKKDLANVRLGVSIAYKQKAYKKLEAIIFD